MAEAHCSQREEDRREAQDQVDEGERQFRSDAEGQGRRTRCATRGGGRVQVDAPAPYLRMFTARAAIRSTVIAESVDSAAINAFAGRVSGIASVGLNAIEFVSDT